VLIRRELPGDVTAVRYLLRRAFTDPAHPDAVPAEVGLVDRLRATDEWWPALSMVAEVKGQIAGYVVCSRAWVGPRPALGLGPLAVSPDKQRRGVGSALMHAVLGAADAMGEPLVVLLGHADYYPRFGFRPAAELGIEAPVDSWGEHFQARPMTGYDPSLRGKFRYAEPFNDV
jgi:putative acetyltransferase